MSDKIISVTFGMLKPFVRLRQQLDEHAACFQDAVRNLEKAQQFVESLLADKFWHEAWSSSKTEDDSPEDQLKQQLDEHAARLKDVVNNLEKAQQFVESLLADKFWHEAWSSSSEDDPPEDDLVDFED